MEGFDKNLIEMHLKLYAGYVNNASILLTKMQVASAALPPYEYGALKRRFGWEFDGMRLHELYFDNLSGKGIPNKESSLYLNIVKQFGSFEKWKEDFIATGTIRGIGWSILYLDLTNGMLINTWINEHDTGHLVRGMPILVMDVFEHAFITQFGLDKLAYIETFFKYVNWDVVQERYKAATPLEKHSLRD